MFAILFYHLQREVLYCYLAVPGTEKQILLYIINFIAYFIFTHMFLLKSALVSKLYLYFSNSFYNKFPETRYPFRLIHFYALVPVAF
jgi:multisubunit Na+/H+ antiporter MnhE subunit